MGIDEDEDEEEGEGSEEEGEGSEDDGEGSEDDGEGSEDDGEEEDEDEDDEGDGTAQTIFGKSTGIPFCSQHQVMLKSRGNILVNVCTLDTSQASKLRLNGLLENICSIVVTLDVSQLLISWSNAEL